MIDKVNNKPEAKKQRLQVDLSERLSALVDQLAADAAITRAELIRRAISLYGILSTELAAGKKFELYDPKTEKRLQLVVL